MAVNGSEFLVLQIAAVWLCHVYTVAADMHNCRYFLYKPVRQTGLKLASSGDLGNPLTPSHCTWFLVT